MTPERVAINLNEARIPDNEGNRPTGGKILPGGPETWYTGIPVRRITARMREEGYRIEVSEDAGSYVCNETFYLAGVRGTAPVEFIHVPAVAEQAEEFAAAVAGFICYCVTDEQ